MASSNSLSSLSKMHLILLHSSVIFLPMAIQKKLAIKVEIASNLKKPQILIGCCSIFHMVWMKVMPRAGRGRTPPSPQRISEDGEAVEGYGDSREITWVLTHKGVYEDSGRGGIDTLDIWGRLDM